MARIAFVAQRYGLEVVGGAETLCRQVVGHLRDRFDVEVITTCALDYVTWANHYAKGRTEIEGVTVYRFPTDKVRNPRFNQLYAQLLANQEATILDEIEWLKQQGPYSSALLQFLRRHRDQYDLFVFVGYLYFHTWFGLPVVADKAILLPTAHDEPPLYFDAINSVFHLPKGLIFLSEEERDLVHRRFRNQRIPWEIIGSGISIPLRVALEDEDRDGLGDAVIPAQADIQTETIDTPMDSHFRGEDGSQPILRGIEFRARHGGRAFSQIYRSEDPYLLYAGRIDESKNCGEMFSFFLQYKKENPGSLRLVCAGKEGMPLPPDADIISLGFLSDEALAEAMARARAVICPSQYESFGLVALEAGAAGTPVLVNGDCDVLRGHCERSNGGLYYTGYPEFAGCLDLLLGNAELRRRLGEQASGYVRSRFTWDLVAERYSGFIERTLREL